MLMPGSMPESAGCSDVTPAEGGGDLSQYERLILHFRLVFLNMVIDFSVFGIVTPSLSSLRSFFALVNVCSAWSHDQLCCQFGHASRKADLDVKRL